MAIRVTLAVIGMFTGFGIIGLAWNNNLGAAYSVITGTPLPGSNTPPGSSTPPGSTTQAPFKFPPFPFPFPPGAL